MENELLSKLVTSRGTILHSNTFPDIDHGKFFVIIGENEKEFVGYFFINSNINHSLANKQEQLDLQYPINHKDYNFLTHTSFIGCHNIKTIEKEKLCLSIQNNKTKIKGQLKEDDLENILEMVRNSRLYSKIEKKTFFKK